MMTINLEDQDNGMHGLLKLNTILLLFREGTMLVAWVMFWVVLCYNLFIYLILVGGGDTLYSDKRVCIELILIPLKKLKKLQQNQ